MNQKRILLSEGQHSLLRRLSKPMKFIKAMELSRRTLFSLLDRGYVEYVQADDSFHITPMGTETMTTFNFSQRIWVTGATANNVRRAESMIKSIAPSKKLTRNAG